MHEWKSRVWMHGQIKEEDALVFQAEAEAALAEAQKEASYARQTLSDRDERVEHLQAKLAAAERECDSCENGEVIAMHKQLLDRIAELEEKLAAALDDGKMMHSALHMWEDVTYPSLQRRIAQLEADCKQYLRERNEYQTLYVERNEEIARLKAALQDIEDWYACTAEDEATTEHFWTGWPECLDAIEKVLRPAPPAPARPKRRRSK